MRITSKDQKVVRAQQQSVAPPSTTQPDALNEASAAACGVPPQAQPLQARSSNSGTSVKRSDNISQSSYPHGDISSDKPGQCSAAWTKTSSTSTTLQQSQHQQQIMPSQLAIGQTTSAFAQKRGDAAGTPTASTANTKNAETATALIGSSSTSLVNKRSGNSRRAATSSAATANQDHSLSSTASGQQDRAVNQSGAQPATSRVSTRASGRQTRQSDQRAVKDSSSAQQQLHQQQRHLNSNSNCNQTHPQQSSSDADAILGALTSGCGSKPAQLMMMQHQVGGGAQSLNNSTLNAGDSSLLMPVKQSCSEQQVSSSMRTTRSKAKAKQQDVRNPGSGQAGAGAAALNRKAQASSSAQNNHISNGQSDACRAPRFLKDNMDGEDHVMNTSKDHADNEAAQVEDSEQILNISAVDGNLEKAANMSQIDLKTSKRNQNDMSHQAWRVAEESKMQSSPRSSLNSTLIAAVAGAENKLVNQSFRINDSTDSLLENPLTTVIKQFQNLRTNAQLTGKNKPTIQQFLEKFEKEMQYLEDQYKAQQQAREEQMRLFEQHYGGKKPVDQFQTINGKQPSGNKPTTGLVASGGHSTSHHPYHSQLHQQHQHLGSNDQVVASASAAAAGQYSHRAGQNQQLAAPGETLMVHQDTATLGPMPHNEQSNNISFNSAVHGPNAQSILGGGSDITHNAEVYESFSFAQNSMLQFYPRQVRKILTRRKTTNSANTIMSELKDLKAPKHKLKTKKTMSKMQSLAICQMNMMQILLQKISRRSKVIRKQEKLVNDNLKRKRIYLERERFDLMSVLRKSLEVTEERELLQQQRQSLQQHPAAVNGVANGSIAALQQQALGGALVQKNKTQQQTTMRGTTTGASDLNSNCLSTSGTKYGADQPNTQSIKGSTAAPIFGDENTSMDGFASRKQTRLQSGAENCLSVAADSVSYKAMHNNIMEGSVKAQQATPEPPSKKPTAVSNNVGVCGEEDMQGDQHQVSHIMDNIGISKDLAGKAQDQIFAPNAHINTSNLMQTPPKINAQQRQISGNISRFNSNNAIALQQQMGVTRDGADSLFDYDQQLLPQEPQQVVPAEPQATMPSRQPVRKMQSTQGKHRKRKSNNLIVNQTGGDGADNTNLSMISHVVGQAPPQLNLEMESMAGENGSFVIADLQQPHHNHHIKTEHLPDGNFAITIKKSNDSAGGATTTQQQATAQFSNNTRQQEQQQSSSTKTGAVARSQASRSKRRQQAYSGAASKTCPTLSIDAHAMTNNNTTTDNNKSSRQKDSAGIIKQQQQDVDMRENGMEGVVVVMSQDQHSQQQQQNALVEQQKHDNQRKLSPLRNIGQEHQQQQNATNVNVQSSMPPMQFESNIDANNFDFSGLQHHHHHNHHHALNMVGNPDHHHLVDHHMQPDHFMMPPTHAAERGQTHHHHGKSSIYPVYHHHHHGHGAPEQVPGNTTGGPHHFQALVPQGQITDLAMHRSQSHLLPNSGHQYHMMEVDPTINPLVEASNLAGHHHPHHPFDQFAHVHFVDAEEEAGQVAAGSGRGGEQDHRNHPHGAKPKNNHDVLNLNFFDESAQELSSIDHSAAAVDQYGYNSQAGPNPYEQAKRQYLKKSMMAAQQAGVPQTGGVRNAAGASSDEDVQQPSYVDRVNQFVSPMVVGLQQLSADQHTPQAKVDGHHHHHAEGANQQSAVVDDVDNTPSHFMSGVDSTVHQAGLGRGTGLGAAQQRRNNAHQQQQQQQLSVQRICGTANGADPFNMSATSGQLHMGGRGGAQNTFGNTPAGLMSNSQPCITDAHRQHLSVSGWNLVDVDEVETAGHHSRQHEEDAHRQQRGHHHHHQIYHQTGGLPEHHHHPYM